MKRTYFIYKLTSPNNKSYIGQTTNINRRFSIYRNLLCINQPKLYNSIKKYGWENFKKEIIFDGVVSQDEINDIETRFINNFFDLGLNLSRLGTGGNGKTGEEHFASKPVLQIDLNFNIVREFESGTAAASFMKMPQTCVSLSCRSDNPKSFGYYWRFKEGYNKEDLIKIANKPHPNTEPIFQLTKKGEFIKEWESQHKASKELKINQANIWRALNGEGLSCGGYIWVRKHDYENNKQPVFRYKKTGKPIIVKDLKGKIIREFESITNASEVLKVDKSTIIRQLKNKITNPKKYIYEYAK